MDEAQSVDTDWAFFVFALGYFLAIWLDINDSPKTLGSVMCSQLRLDVFTKRPMLARLQQIISIALMLFMAGAWYYFGSHAPVVALLISISPVALYALVLCAEFHFSARSHLQIDLPVSSLVWWRVWASELFTGPAIFCWRQPFRTNSEADNLASDLQQGRRGVVLVHGLFCNRAFWAPWMKVLRRDQRCFMAVNLEPVFGSIECYAGQISTAVATVAAATGRPVLVVCHSMGGLAARAWLTKAGDQAPIHRIVTIATPHHGTWLARFGYSANAREMRLASTWLTHLNNASTPELNRKFVCWYSDTDNIVFPSVNACLPGADNRLVRGQAHVCLAFAPVVVTQTLALLDEPSHVTVTA